MDSAEFFETSVKFFRNSHSRENGADLFWSYLLKKWDARGLSRILWNFLTPHSREKSTEIFFGVLLGAWKKQELFLQGKAIKCCVRNFDLTFPNALCYFQDSFSVEGTLSCERRCKTWEKSSLSRSISALLEVGLKIWPRKIGCVGIGLEDWQIEERMAEWGIPTARWRGLAIKAVINSG